MELRTDVVDESVDVSTEAAYQATLSAPLDDMHAFLAGTAETRTLVVDDELAGCCTSFFIAGSAHRPTQCSISSLTS